MLKGLRVKIVSSQQVFEGIYRLESEFFNSETIDYEYKKNASDVIEFSQYGTSKELNENKKGYPVLRLNEFNGYFIDTPSKYCDIIDEETYESLKLKKDDVLICRTNGNPKFVGKSALVAKDYNYAFASYLFRVRPNKDVINSAALVAYLNSKFGRQEIEKFSMVGNQANFSPAKFREIEIPILPARLCEDIQELLNTAFEKFELANQKYTYAKTYLYEELGMPQDIDNRVIRNIKSFKESFLVSKRLDAEYYQPKYDILKIFLCGQQTDKLGNIVSIEKSIEPGSEQYTSVGIPFIRVAELSKFGLSEAVKKLDENKYINALKPLKDTILLSKDGSIGIAYKVTHNLNVITSSAILHLKVIVPNILPDYLTLIINSPIVKLQAERDSGGTILQHWKPSEIENVVVPILPYNKQLVISNLITESFKLREESLALQKRATSLIENELS